MRQAVTTVQYVFAGIGGFMGWFLGGLDGFLYAQKRNRVTNRTRVAFSFGRGGVEMPEECNNITYNYIMLFKCVTYFTNSI